MQTALTDTIKNTAEGREADAILRSCVHCGFCLATCPTYNLLGDELDSPRGRIYLIKQLAEGQPVTAKTQTHLDRCMTCMSCETTCPSGVHYGRLLEIGRHWMAQRVQRDWKGRLTRWAFWRVAPQPALFNPLLRLGRAIRPVLPVALRQSIPDTQTVDAFPQPVHERRMLVLDGCVQPTCAPRINAAAARVLDKLGISLIRAAGCCGALSYHMDAQQDGKAHMRRNIDAWWPLLESGAEAIVSTASGCGVMVKDYGRILQDDPHYSEKAARIAALTKDLSEVLRQEDTSRLSGVAEGNRKVAVHSPCSLQHAQKLPGVVEGLLRELGFALTVVTDTHLCCGFGGGAYALLQPDLANQALRNKLDALESGKPDMIVTANIGCLLHLQSQAHVPVRHWVELLSCES